MFWATWPNGKVETRHIRRTARTDDGRSARPRAAHHDRLPINCSPGTGGSVGSFRGARLLTDGRRVQVASRAGRLISGARPPPTSLLRPEHLRLRSGTLRAGERVADFPDGRESGAPKSRSTALRCIGGRLAENVWRRTVSEFKPQHRISSRRSGTDEDEMAIPEGRARGELMSSASALGDPDGNTSPFFDRNYATCAASGCATTKL